MNEICVSEAIDEKLTGKTIDGASWLRRGPDDECHDTLSILFDDGTTFLLKSFSWDSQRSGFTGQYGPAAEGAPT